MWLGFVSKDQHCVKQQSLRRSFLFALCFLSLLVFLLASCSRAFARTPLLQEGKRTVYQRVVSHPNCKLWDGPLQSARELQELRTFTVLYIYGRSGERLEVGVSSKEADGWIDANSATEWPQAITMVFTDRTGRDPVLFFKDQKSLVSTCQAEQVKPLVNHYLEVFQKGGQEANFPIVASEPVKTSVAEKNFYLMPVFKYDTRFNDLKLLEVASIDPGSGEVHDKSKANEGAYFRIGFAFVIDTTISMGPYIQQTTELIKHLYNALEKSPYADKMAFAVVAFRSSTAKTPGLEYTAKVICDFTTVKERKRLEDALEKVKEATVSSHAIDEDSFAGIREAAEKLSWENYGSKIMLMVTDAGPLGPHDPNSLTKFSSETLADYLRQKKIYLTCAHILGKNTASDHRYAASAYRTLTMQSDNQASYLAIPAKTKQQGAQAFRKTAKVLAESYGQLLKATATGQFLSKPTSPKGSALSPEEEARRIAQTTGYAMQLQFLGNRQKSSAPRVIRAWIADADLAKLEEGGGAPVLACVPCVLLTKAQLNTLYTQLKLIFRASEEAFLNGDVDLFGQIRSAAAQLIRDPKQFNLNPERNLLENNLLDEVLADLPYKSVVASLTQRDWENYSTGERQAFLLRLKELLARYEEYDRDATHWESFGSTNPDDWVYRVPLTMLP